MTTLLATTAAAVAAWAFLHRAVTRDRGRVRRTAIVQMAVDVGMCDVGMCASAFVAAFTALRPAAEHANRQVAEFGRALRNLARELDADAVRREHDPNP